MGFLRLGLLESVLGPTGQALIGLTVEPGMFKNFALAITSYQSGGGYAFPADFNSDGYPKNGTTPASNVFGIIRFPSNLAQSEQLVLKWRSGTGRVQLSRGSPGFTSVTATTGSIIGSTVSNLVLDGTAARCVFNFDTSVPTSINLSFNAGVAYSGDFAGVVLCRASDEAAIDAATTPEEFWDDNYIAAHQTLNPKIVRPMGWTNPNSGNVSQSRYLPAWETALTLSTSVWHNGAWAGTASGTDTYTCASQPDATGAYVDGEMIQVQFTNANTGASTIDSGGRGVVPILRGSGGGTAGAIAANRITANQLATLTYDSVLGSFLHQGEGQTPCIPYELQVAFANRVNAHYWMNFHGYVDNASVTAITNLIRDGLDSHLHAYFEYGNEIWNSTFPATAWSREKGLRMGFALDNDRRNHGWYGLRHRLVMALVTSAWSPRSTTQLKRVLAHQAYGATSGNDLYRFKGTDLVTGDAEYNAYTGSVSYNASPNRPIDYTDVLSYATYYSGGELRQFDLTYVQEFGAGLNINGLTAAADDYDSGVPAQMASALAWLDNDIQEGTKSSGAVGDETLQDLNGTGGLGRDIYGDWETVAASYDASRALLSQGPLEYHCYEGGQGGVAPTTATCTSIGISTTYGGPGGKIDNLITAYRNSDLFYDTVLLQITQFMSRAHSVTPGWLLIIGPNAWSLSTGDLYAAKYKSWDAMVDYNH